MTVQSGEDRAAAVRGDVAVLVPAAGAGTRLGPGAPKALRDLAGVPLLVHAVRGLVEAPSVGCVVVAAPPGGLDAVGELLRAEVPPPVALVVVEGGATRQESVALALVATPAAYSIILVHDAARALTPPDQIERVAAAVRSGQSAVIPVLPVADTIKQVDADDVIVATVDRGSLRAVQTPQGFQRVVLAAAHEAAAHHPADNHRTDDAGLVEQMGVRVHTVAGSDRALKITRPVDLVIAEALLRVL
jgi:2-C-methyl-D-erythritol 4-phosphate cytidylyltransferase